jgi:sugar O-acyltransferase (sialic acid O-acetyltransferase NeuD family)
MRLVIFGVSNLIGHYLDCALALGLTPSRIVMNMPEVVRARTRSVHDRVKCLAQPPEIIQMEDFSPRQGECYFIGTTSPGRRQLVEDIRSRFGITCCQLVHPAACISPHATLAEGVYVSAYSVVGPGADIGEHAFISAQVHVGHDTIVEPYARLLGGCNVAGHVRIGRSATIGMGATVIEELEVGAEAWVAAGAVVLQDVPPRVLVAGVPAKLKKNLQAPMPPGVTHSR